ncbi:MAG: acylneuraminate cytidylyltransferase [Melioribacter sp.]|nr:acylneuraminate cytidylyltransferase [Melioribacter sp.]
MKIITVIQARMSSTRLPGKVMLPLLGKPLLIRMIERVNLAQHVGDVIVATSTNPDDDEIERLCAQNNLICFRGHLTDLLDRHYQVAKQFNADAVVKIPSDCPLIDPKVIDKVIEHYVSSDEFDFVSNLHPATYPDGNDVEIFSFESLECAWKDATKDYEREHTTPFIWEHQDVFSVGNVAWETGYDYSSTHRWTIDFPEDYEFIRKVYDELYSTNPAFSLNDILTLLKQKTEIAEINQQYLGKYWYENHLDELTHIDEYKNKIKRNE